MEIWRQKYRVHLAFCLENFWYFDCVFKFLTFSLSCLTRMRAHRALFHTHRQTDRHPRCHLQVLWSHAVVWLSPPQCWACCSGEKPAFGQILFRRIKKAMSSCLHQSTLCLWCFQQIHHCSTVSPPFPFSLSLSHLVSSGCITSSVPLASLCLFPCSSVFSLSVPRKTL